MFKNLKKLLFEGAGAWSKKNIAEPGASVSVNPVEDKLVADKELDTASRKFKVKPQIEARVQEMRAGVPLAEKAGLSLAGIYEKMFGEKVITQNDIKYSFVGKKPREKNIAKSTFNPLTRKDKVRKSRSDDTTEWMNGIKKQMSTTPPVEEKGAPATIQTERGSSSTQPVDIQPIKKKSPYAEARDKYEGRE